jgi:hypothetical protein
MPAFQDFDAQTGIKTTVHYLEDAGKTVIQKTYDAQPLVDACAEARAVTEGERWGDMRHIGTIPMAELATMMRQDGTIDKKRCIEFLKKNPAFVTFNKALR